MNHSTRFTCSLLCSALLFSSASAIAAGTLTGQITVQVTIGDACTIGNGSSASGVNNWGTMNFGTYGDLAMAVNGSLLGADGASALTVTCSAGLTPRLSLNAGANSGSGELRYMASGANRIAYRLYSDSARSVPFAIDTPVTLANSTQSIPIYGRILPVDQTSTTPASGAYQDIVIATLVW